MEFYTHGESTQTVDISKTGRQNKVSGSSRTKGQVGRGLGLHRGMHFPEK